MRLIVALAGVLVAILALPGSLMAQQFDLDLQFTEVVDTDNGLVHINHAGDGSGRLFLVRQQGYVLIQRNGELLTQPFLDINDDISFGGEQGLFSIAFPPGFANKQYFYVMYTDLNGTDVVSRFGVSNDNADQADPDSEQVIIRVPQPFGNHNGGQLAFGPDGMLYIALGDGGSANDPDNHAQNLGDLLGTILRLDVESGASPYAIPPDNPFVGSATALPEIWAYGLRNPWRFSFDSQTGDLFIADVGQSNLEEVDFVAAGSPGGLNFGWKVMEGTVCTTSDCDPDDYELPVFEYDHNQGCSITGGHVYRGGLYPNLFGVYLFADFCTGNIWALEQRNGQWVGEIVAERGFGITTFGQDEAGNMYLGTSTGSVQLISDGPPVPNTVPITSGFTGAWYDPNQNGHGLFVEVLSDGRILVWWFTFDDDGNQMWFGGVGQINGDLAVIEVYRTEGGRFIPNFDPDDITNTLWGILTLIFFDCNHGRVDFDSDLGFGIGFMELTRITLPAGLICEG